MVPRRLTLHVRRDLLPPGRPAARRSQLRFELCLGVSGLHYPHETGRELHASTRWSIAAVASGWKCLRRTVIRTSLPVRDLSDQRLAQQETYDFFGIIFDGHPV